MIEHIQGLQRQMTGELEAVLMGSPENRRYYTGFSSSAGWLLVSREGAVFLTDSRYYELAQRTVTGCEVRLLQKGKEELAQAMEDLKVGRVGLEAERLTVAAWRRLREQHPEREFLIDGQADAWIRRQRSVKTPREVALISRAQAIAEEAFAHLLTVIAVGRTEKELQLELDSFLLRNGAEELSFESIVVGGANSSLPHGRPTDYRLQKGDFLTMDFGAVVEGYHSDMTRTVAVGAADEQQREVYRVVLEAQQAAIQSIASGVTCKQADQAAREVIEQAGYGDFFGHGTGHGVGLEIHEVPNLSPRSEEVLRQGMVVTAEPGVYLPGRFGVRIEDMVLVTDDGSQSLAHAGKELLIL